MERRYGNPKSEKERRESHEGKYGGSEPPERGTGLKGNPVSGGRGLSFTQRLISVLEAGLFAVIHAIIGANRDYPYHDFVSFDDTDEPILYQVGKNNMTVKGDQSKLFVSKSTLVMSDVTCTIRFNATNNTPITIRPDVLYHFHSNISSVYVSAIGSGGYIDLAFEGVLPQEVRDAE